MLKRPSVLCSSYNNFYILYCQNSSLNASAAHSRSPRDKTSPRTTSHCRSYATVRPDRSRSDQADNCLWPELPPNTLPTPYQIFKLKKDAPYSKSRFYELAKLYHPDRNGHDLGQPEVRHLHGTVKMERYRLIVAAHEILSDPAKRSAYDASGAGWNGRPEHGAPKYHWAQNHGTAWSSFDTNDSPFRNATWEDWEKWYQRDRDKQEPVYISNGGFLMLVIVAVFLGGFSQSLRVGEHATLFQRQVTTAHNDASKAIKKHRIESMGAGNRDERLQNFLMSRDPHGYGIIDQEEEVYRKLLPDRELCMSEGIHQQGRSAEQ